MYDILIRGGRVVDGTGSPAYPADVAVQGGRIAAMGANLAGEAKTVVDAAVTTANSGKPRAAVPKMDCSPGR